jgi:hypothetical protein
MDSKRLSLNELRRLNRTGEINDEEYLVLRRFIESESVPPAVLKKFRRLFVEKTKPPYEDDEFAAGRKTGIAG